MKKRLLKHFFIQEFKILFSFNKRIDLSYKKIMLVYKKKKRLYGLKGIYGPNKTHKTRTGGGVRRVMLMGLGIRMGQGPDGF